MHPVPRVHQSIHQEVPVVRGLDHHARQLFTIRRQCRYDLLQIVGQALLIHDSIFLVTDNYDTVVRVQVNSAKLHMGLLRVKAGSHLNFSPAASTRTRGPLDDYHSIELSTQCARSSLSEANAQRSARAGAEARRAEGVCGMPRRLYSGFHRTGCRLLSKDFTFACTSP